MGANTGKFGITRDNPSSDEIKKLLETAVTIAVVGLSSRMDRPSHGVSKYLASQGYKIIPVNPKESKILDQKCYPDLISIPDMIDIVDVFRKPAAAVQITRDAIAIGAKSVWLQETVISPDAFSIGISAGLIMIMDRCILKEHRRLVLNG